MLVSCESYFFSAQGQMNERGSARAPRHRLLHYVVQVKPLALCHWRRFSVSGRAQRWPSGFSSDQNSLSSLSSPSAAAAAPDPAAQLFTAARLRRSEIFHLVASTCVRRKRGGCGYKPIPPGNWARQEIKT